MGHVAPQAPPGPPPRTPSPGLHSPVDDRAPAGRINGYTTLNQATKTGTCDRVPDIGPSNGHAATLHITNNSTRGW